MTTKSLQYGSGLAATLLLCASSAAHGQTYDHSFQQRVGGQAVFHTTGPATEIDGVVQDENGDAFLTAIEMPDGSRYTDYYRPVAVHGFQFTQGQGTAISVRGGTNITVGDPGKHRLGDEVSDGDSNYFSDADVQAFSERVQRTFANKNLNSYIDMGGSSPEFEFIIEFNMELTDNDPGDDDFGELLYFERGRDGGNSWLTIQAVDKDGNALGPALAISPHETVKTDAPVMVWGQHDQYMGALAIDISRLGVTKTKYLKVRKTVSSDSGWYNSGHADEDYNPDFKFMAVITDPTQLSLINALYD